MWGGRGLLCGSRGSRGELHKQRVQRKKGATADWVGGRARGELSTSNMLSMSVTQEVSQLEMSALKLCKPLKRSRMWVTPGHTHQSAMGP